MVFDEILVEDDNGVRIITLNRPDRLNAWTYRMGAELADAVRAGNEDDAVEAFVVTGAGRGFCAGADVAEVFDAQRSGEPRSEGGQCPRLGWSGPGVKAHGRRDQRCRDRCRAHPGAAL